MYAAITTRYHGPTNTRGSRIKATCQAGSLTLPYDSSDNADALHTKAAKMLAKRMEWRGHWYGGCMPDGRGYAFVCNTKGTSDFAIWEIDGVIKASGE